MTTIMKDMRIAQLCSKSERTLLAINQYIVETLENWQKEDYNLFIFYTEVVAEMSFSFLEL